MKTISLLFTCVLFVTNLFSQDISGTWNGALDVMGQKLPLVFHIEKSESGYSSKMDSPKQGAFGLPMNSTIFENDSLTILSEYGFSYRGFFSEEKFTGEFEQNGMVFPLILSQEKLVLEEPKRPQEPKKPYPYHSEEVYFENKEAEITLAGTLTFPKEKGKFPAVILISGSGPQDRNEEIFDHKPFLVLSDFLTRNGIAVLRYDDRGTAESEGDFSTATSADFATDTKATLDYLLTRKEIDKNQIGLIGHSEGGMIAPMLASKSDDVAFLVLLAGPGIPGDELLALQGEAIYRASGMDEAELKTTLEENKAIFTIVANSPKDSLKSNMTVYLKNKHPDLTKEEIETEIKKITPWFHFFLKYDPRPALEKTKVPVLALNGEKDLQVPAEVNLNAIESALKKGGNKQVTTKILPGLNHLFQESTTGLPSEYGKIEQTFSPEAMQVILDWIEKQTK